jgi:hypothetical protein
LTEIKIFRRQATGDAKLREMKTKKLKTICKNIFRNLNKNIALFLPNFQTILNEAPRHLTERHSAQWAYLQQRSVTTLSSTEVSL